MRNHLTHPLIFKVMKCRQGEAQHHLEACGSPVRTSDKAGRPAQTPGQELQQPQDKSHFPRAPAASYLSSFMV